MKTTRSLRRQIRALWACHVLLAAVLCTAATPAVRSLFLDEANHPTRPVDLASANWTGSPDALTGLLYGNGTGNLSAATGAQVSALVTGDINPSSVGEVTLGFGQFASLLINGAFSSDNEALFTDGSGNMTASSFNGQLNGPVNILGSDVIGYSDGTYGNFDFLTVNQIAQFNGTFDVGSSVTIGMSLTLGGYLSSDNGQLFSDGGGNLSANSLYASSVSSNNLTTDSGAIYTSGRGDMSANSFYAAGGIETGSGANLIVGGTTSLDGGNITTDGQGGVSINALTVNSSIVTFLNGDYITGNGTNLYYVDMAGGVHRVQLAD